MNFDFKDIEEVTVDFKKWMRGEDTSSSCLLDGQGYRCCLGFECQQRGIPDDMIYYKLTPADISINVIIPGMTKEGALTCPVPRSIFLNTKLVNECVNVNDDERITDGERMCKLIDIFKKRKLKLKFINVPAEFGGPIVE